MVGWPEKKEETLEGDQGELTKGPLTVQSVFPLGLKCSEWVNSRT